MENERVSFIDGQPPDWAKSLMFSVIEKNEPISRGKLTKLMPWAYGTVERVLTCLRNEGQVMRVGVDLREPLYRVVKS